MRKIILGLAFLAVVTVSCKEETKEKLDEVEDFVNLEDSTAIDTTAIITEELDEVQADLIRELAAPRERSSTLTEDPENKLPSQFTDNNGDFDWFETRVLNPHISVESLYESIGSVGFVNLKPKEEYWKNKKIRDVFWEVFGSYAKDSFNQTYYNLAEDLDRFRLGKFQKSKTAYELARDSEETFKVELINTN
nr:hypothetical protein [uncultured Flavobacterium sp.]